MAATIEQVNMTEGALLPKIVRFSLPLAATGVLQLLFNAADVIVVGKFAGATALAAVGATTALVALLVNALMSISVGVNILVARYLGCREYDRVRTCVHTVFALSFVLGLIVMVAGLTLSTPLLELMKTPEDVLPLSSLYLRIYFIGVPGTVMYNFGAALLRAFGDTKRPMVFLTVSGVVNACLNLFFVIVCHMSVDGVATATVISQYISLFLVVRCLCRSEGLSHLELKEIRLDKEESIRMIQIGFPAGLQSMLFSISNVLVQSSVNSFGASVVAANTAASNIEGFIYTAMNSVFHAAITFTSQNLGAGKLSRTKRVYGSCIATSLMIGLPMCLVYFLFAPSLLSIYVSSADPSYQDVINYGLIRMRWLGCFQFLGGLMEDACGMVRGLGKSWLPMFVTGIGACLSRIIWIYTVFQAVHTPEILYLSYPLSWILTALMHVVCFILTYRNLAQRLANRPSTAI